MRNKISWWCRACSLLLAAVLVMGALALPLAVSADEPTKTKHTYDIAVAFDNSGSMYQDGNKAWSRAKYAMEIFASMLNYDNGDKLTVFPMWEVTTDGNTPTGSQVESTAPVEIRGKADIDKLSRMYTVCPWGTPYTPVDKAFSYLKSSKATDKWLIVLTDGAFNAPYGDEATLRQDLLKKATGGIKVQYLRFAGGSSIKSDTQKGFYADSCDDTSLITKLVGICNAIFQRAALPASSLQGNKLTLNISMNNLIVFVQGEGAKITGLKDSSGKAVTVTMDSGQRKFSDLKYSNGRYTGNQTDTTLYGQVVTFAACPKGEYTLEYTGSKEAVQIFYEPDVKIRVELRNSDGIAVKPENGELEAGTYSVHSIIVDSKTDEDVTNHPLMGDDVSLKTLIKTSSDSDYKEYPNGATVTLTPDSATEIVVEGTYLKDFTITTKDDPDAIPLPLWVIDPKPAFDITAKVEQSQGWYNLKKSDSWKPVRVDITLEGQPMTDEQLEATKMTFTTDKSLPLRSEMIPGQSAYYVYIGQDEAGKFTAPDKGKYSLTAKGAYPYEEGREVTAEAKVSFEIQPYAKIWKILFWVLLILALILLFVWWYTHKVFPKRITLHRQSTKNKGFQPTGERQKISKSFTLRDSGNTIFTAKAQKVTPWFKRKGSNATIKLVNIQAGANVRDLKVGATKIKADERIATVGDSDIVKFTNSAGAEKKYQIRINSSNK